MFQKYQAALAALPAIFLLAFKVSAFIGSLGSVIEAIGMWRTWSSWIAVGKKLEAIGTDFPKLLNNRVRPILIRLGVKGFSVLVLLFACTRCASKPCPVVLEAQYTAELVEACSAADAGSIAACKDAGVYEDVHARHIAAQEDAGCRVKP